MEYLWRKTGGHHPFKAFTAPYGRGGVEFDSLAAVRKFERDNADRQTCVEAFSYNNTHAEEIPDHQVAKEQPKPPMIATTERM